MFENEEQFEKLYYQFIMENYYGGGSEPITPDYFKECWMDMSEDEKARLIERAEKK